MTFDDIPGPQGREQSSISASLPSQVFPPTHCRTRILWPRPQVVLQADHEVQSPQVETVSKHLALQQRANKLAHWYNLG